MFLEGERMAKRFLMLAALTTALLMSACSAA